MVDVREVDFVTKDIDNNDVLCHGLKIYNTKTELTCCIDLHKPFPVFWNFKVIKQYQTINLRDDQ